MPRRISLFLAAIIMLAATGYSAAHSAPADPETAIETPEYHIVQKGETLYGISKKFGVPVDRIIELNPSVNDGVRAGERIRLGGEPSPASDAAENVAPKAEKKESPAVAQPKAHEKKVAKKAKSATSKYTIREGETLYRIAANHGTTVEEILRLNPDFDIFNYSAGDVIILPIEGEEEIEEIEEESPAADQSEGASEKSAAASAAASVSPVEPGESVYPVKSGEAEVPEAEGAFGEAEAPEAEEVEVTGEAYNIAVMLPLMLSEEKPSRAAEMYTDFYKGLLLAADTLSHRGARINIYAYDTASNLDTIAALMQRPEMAEMHLFIGPDKDEHFNYLVSAVDDDTAFIVNSFAVKNDSYKTNPHVIQTNIPHDMMYTRAIDAFIEENVGKTPVFLSRISGAAEKEPFVSQLKQRLTDEGIEYKEITFRNVLTEDDFSGLDIVNNYVFVPISGARAEFIKMVPALKSFKEQMVDPTGFALFGYPEWLAFRGDMAENLSTLNAMLYSRFYYDQNSYRAARVAEKFRQTYGEPMIDAVPSQGLLGYDTGCFVINALRKNKGDFHADPCNYDGLQTDFILEDDDIDGLVNTSLVLVIFSENGITESRKI